MQNPIQVGFTIETQANERLDVLAAHLGVSRSFLVQRLVEHADEEYAAAGHLTWWPEPEGLPIDTR